MNEESLKLMLRDADAEIGPPSRLPSDLSRRVRERASVRQPVRFGAVPIAAAILLVVTWVQLLDPNATPLPERLVSSDPGDVREAPAVAHPGGLPQELRTRPLAGIQTDGEWASRIQREFDDLDREAAWRTATLTRTRELLKRAPVAPTRAGYTNGPATDYATQSAVLLAAQKEVDRAASILVKEANRMARDPRQRPEAIEKLERVLRLFPQTPWATVAQQKLTQLLELSGAQSWKVI